MPLLLHSKSNPLRWASIWWNVRICISKEVQFFYFYLSFFHGPWYSLGKQSDKLEDTIMKRNNVILRLLMLCGLLTMFFSAVSAFSPSYQVFFYYDNDLCDFELYCGNEPVQNGDYVSKTYDDSSLGANEVPLWFDITNIEEGYRIRDVQVNDMSVPYATIGHYGEGTFSITRDAFIEVILEEIPDTLPGLAQVGIYTLDEYSGDNIPVEAVMLEYGVCERLQASVLTTDGYVTELDYSDAYPDFLISYEWEFSTDGNNWIPFHGNNRWELYIPYVGMPDGYPENYFMDLPNYYLRVHVRGPEQHFSNADIYSAPIPVNNPAAMPTQYRLTLNYNPSLCTLTPIVFNGMYGEEVENGALLDPGSDVCLFLDYLSPGARIRDCTINAERYDRYDGTSYFMSLLDYEQIEFIMNSNTSVDLVVENDYTVSTVESATISTSGSDTPLQSIELDRNTDFLDVDVVYENGVKDPDYFPSCRWQYSLDGTNWIDLDNSSYNDRLNITMYRNGISLIDAKDYYLRAQLIGRTKYCTTSTGTYIYTDPILVNPTAPPEPENPGFKLTFIYDDSLCDFSVYDWYTDIPVSNGGVLPIDPDANRAYGVMEITNIKDGYRIKDFLINGDSRVSTMIDGAYGGGAFTINKNSTLEVVLEQIPDPLPCIASATIHLQSGDGAPLTSVTFTPGEVENVYANINFSDSTAEYPDYFTSCRWEYSTDKGATWTEVPGWGRISNFYAAWSWYTEQYDIDFMAMQDYYLRVCVEPKDYYSQTPDGNDVCSAPILVNPTQSPEPPAPAPEVCPEFADICDVEIEQDGSSLSVVLRKTEDMPEMFTFTSWVAKYDDNGRMVGLEALAHTVTADGMRFDSQTASDGDLLFILTGSHVPVINALTLN